MRVSIQEDNPEHVQIFPHIRATGYNNGNSLYSIPVSANFVSKSDSWETKYKVSQRLVSKIKLRRYN
jgi:hypothetical protein